MPRLSDDGSRVTLDLHGASLAEAEALVLRTVQLAAERGRTTVEVIHGHSTSDPGGHNRTIKHLLHDLIDRGVLPGVSGAFKQEGSTLLSLPLGTAAHRQQLTLRDVW